MKLTYETTDFRGTVEPYQPKTTNDMVGYRTGRVYGYDLAPAYLSVTIWCFASGGRRLRSDRFHPAHGLSHRERYDACVTMIKGVGLVPPPYQQP